jgi:hypothetical protein
MIECKNAIRANPHIKREEILRHIRDQLNPACEGRGSKRGFAPSPGKAAGSMPARLGTPPQKLCVTAADP